VRNRKFGLLANRRRATTLPLCFQLLGSGPEPQVEPEVSSPVRAILGFAPTVVVDGGRREITADEIQLRSPPKC
jgi:hypothetical protein